MKTHSHEAAFPQYHHELGHNEVKTRHLILYISRHGFGLTRLNKALWKADFDAYAATGRAITGEEYQHIPFGPGLRRMKPLLSKMQQAGDLRFEAAQEFEEQRPIPLIEPDTDLFSTEELAFVDAAVAIIEPMTAKEAELWSHDFPGWRLTDEGEVIPYEWVFWSERPLTESEVAYGLSLDRAI
ncbi:MAG: Panacea domain-containing protein [Acidimicrobiales bacterium]